MKCRIWMFTATARELWRVDALYINGGGWDAAPAIDYLERDLKIKVVWALAAEMWLTYHILKIENPVPGGGVLLSGNYAPGQAAEKAS